MNQPQVTVIIPVYKAEKDIARCCRALFGQTLDSIEYIFVNDCTPDNSVEVIEQVQEEYPQRKPSVKILHQPKNSGVSACRQLGLENATGEFVIHCDSDDWPELDMYEVLYAKALADRAEVVCCGFRVEYADHSTTTLFPESSVGHPSFDISPIEGAVWNKLVRRSLLTENCIGFPKGVNLGEDCYVVTAARVLAKKESMVQQPLYHYNQMNTGSITHNYTKQKFLEVVKWVDLFDQFLQSKGLKEKYDFQLGYMKFQAKAYFLMFPEVRDIKLWCELFPEANAYIMSYPSRMYLRLAAWLAAHRMTGFCTMILNLKSLIAH